MPLRGVPPIDASQGRDGAFTTEGRLDLRNNALSERCAVVAADCCVSQVETMLCNRVQGCRNDFPLRCALDRPQRHASLKPPPNLGIYSRGQHVALGISRERVKSAFAAAEQVDCLGKPGRRTSICSLLL